MLVSSDAAKMPRSKGTSTSPGHAMPQRLSGKRMLLKMLCSQFHHVGSSHFSEGDAALKNLAVSCRWVPPPVVMATTQDDAKTRREYGSGTTGPSPARHRGQRRSGVRATGRPTWKPGKLLDS